jgi:hypothetical protein
VRRIARNQCYLVALHYPRRHAWAILVAQLLWGLVAARHGAGLAWLRGKMQGFQMAAKLGKPAANPPDDFLLTGERIIYEIQQATGFDWYWRLYFLLTGSRLSAHSHLG